MSIAPSESGKWRLTVRLLGQWPVVPDAASLIAIGCVSLAIAIAAPLGVWMMPIGGPYRSSVDLAADYLVSLPPMALILGSLLLVPISIIILVVRVCTPRQSGDWLWESNTVARLAMASAAVLPVPALVLSGVGLVGIAADPAAFSGNISAVHPWWAWLLPASMLALAVGLPALWVVTFRGMLRSARASLPTAEPACFACGYSLVGLQTATCPECGAELQLSSPRVSGAPTLSGLAAEGG